MNAPVIQLKVHGVEHAVYAQLSAHQMSMDTMAQDAIKKVCTPENINTVVEAEVTHVLNTVLKDSIYSLFHYGEGRHLVNALAAKVLKNASEQMLKLTEPAK